MALKPIKGILAIPPSETEDLSVLSECKELAGDQLDDFRKAGWRFIATPDFSEQGADPVVAGFSEVETPQPMHGAQRATENGPVHPRHVYRDSAGHVVIEGAAMVVKFKQSVESDRARALLGDRGLRIKRPLGFVKNGFQVVPGDSDSDVDLLELAADLEQENDVEYAEPATIEHIGQRA